LASIDIFLGQRVYNKEWLAGIFTQRERYGFSFIYEIDDSLDTIDFSNPAFRYFRYKNKKEVLDIYHNALKYSDSVFTTTEYLAGECRRWASRADVLPNGIPTEDLLCENIPLNSVSNKVRLLYHGGSSHHGDVLIALNALEQMLNKYKNLEIFFWGFMPDRGIDITTREHGLHGKDFEYSLKFYKKYRDRIDFYPFVDTELFHPLMSTFQADLAIAPLKGSKFDNAKSELKAVECGFLGIPIITGDVFPYRKIIKNGVNGFIAERPRDWIRYLELLISNKEKRMEMGRNLKKTATEEYDLERIAFMYSDYFEEIIPKQDYGVNDWWEHFGVKDLQPNQHKMVTHN
jgi:glycosyltransferase involved in cell wall biosynthesis